MASRPEPPAAKPANSRPSAMSGSWLALALLAFAAFVAFSWMAQPREITDSEFHQLADGFELQEVTFIGSTRAEGTVKDPNSPLAQKFKLVAGKFAAQLVESKDRAAEAKELEKRYADHDKATPADKQTRLVIRSRPEEGPWLGPLLLTLLPTALIIGVLFFFLLPRMRDPGGQGGFLNNYVRSPARRYEKGKNRVTFGEVAGLETTKQELQEVVDFLRAPEKFQRLGAQVPKGVLLIGPPGTGKTLLAKAVAGEANVPFFSINGSEFIQMFVGVGASRVRDLFKTAKENAPCLVFIDEIDAVGRMRGAGVGGGSDEREQTLNQILSEMDGFTPSEMVIVIAATNRPDVLDAALLRPGRFDRHVTIDRPDRTGRLGILKVHTRNKPLADDVDLEALARKMTGMTGADLRNLCNEAALLAARLNKNKIDRNDFEGAADRVLVGPRREEVLTDAEKRHTAVHESGHALCALLEPLGDPVYKMSIIPRGRALGVTHMLPDEDRHDHSQGQLMARLVMTMGGRAADRLVFDEVTSGANQDLKQATRIARLMVAQFGMSEKVGPVAYRIGEEHVFLGKELSEARDFSEGTLRVIDEEVQRILREADRRAYDLLTANRACLDRLSQVLLEREEMSRAEIEEVVRQFVEPPPHHTYDETARPVDLAPSPSPAPAPG